MKGKRKKGKGKYHDDIWDKNLHKIFYYLYHNPRKSINQIAKDTKLNRGTVTKHIEQLMKEGMVTTLRGRYILSFTLKVLGVPSYDHADELLQESNNITKKFVDSMLKLLPLFIESRCEELEIEGFPYEKIGTIFMDRYTRMIPNRQRHFMTKIPEAIKPLLYGLPRDIIWEMIPNKYKPQKT